MTARGRAAPRLFEPHELDLRRTGAARLRDLARRPPLPPSARQQRADEDRAVIDRLRGWAVELAGTFRLRYASIDPERDGVTEWYGVCYEDGVIRIRLRHARSGKLLKESSLVDTLCHELAHLRHMDHGLRFRKLYARILERARDLGYYRPGPQDGRPRQQLLFRDVDCGSTPGRRN